MRRIISILITVLSMVNSRCTIDGDVNQLQSALQESANYMSTHAKGEDVFICVGEPRAGKSSLVNYLIGTELKAVKLNRYEPHVLEKVNEKSPGPDIGHGVVSKTTIPTRWVSKIHENLIIWDAAGFGDNRGTIQDITNAFYIYQLIREVKSLKIILVIDIQDILNDSTEKFLNALRALENLFGEGLNNYYSSIAVIFSKVEKTFRGYTLDTEFITDKLEYQFLSDNALAMSKITKGFIKYLTKHPKQIGLFRRAEAIGKITSDIDVNISQAISSCESIPNKNLLQLRPSISQNSKVCLHEFREKFSSTSSFMKLEEDIKNLLENMTSKKNIYSEIPELEVLLINLYSIKNFYNIFAKFNFDSSLQLKILRGSSMKLRRTIDTTNLLNAVNLFEFVNELLGYSKRQSISVQLENVFSSAMRKIDELIFSIADKIKQIEKADLQKNGVKNDGTIRDDLISLWLSTVKVIDSYL